MDFGLVFHYDEVFMDLLVVNDILKFI
ncbi:hypothetical protein OIU84_029218 [Salix udensis]|uniref:Uncharacterized protein n=1 Tax=Salix udensis TaxID=889485 RepID=A0AAD6P7K3_9ROSI|nr:hypothetical protein OIU84_029218 [Salix udensis]